MSSDDDRRRNISEGIHIAKANTSIKTSASKVLRDRDKRRHSREDALTDREFETLVRASYEMKESQALEARMALFATGKLGLRGGELAHLHFDWIDWQDSVVEVPEFDQCTKGKFDGEICGYCRRRAIEELKTNNLTVQEAVDAIHHEYDDDILRDLGEDGIRNAAHDLRDQVNITYEEATSRRWKPKTDQAARRIPYDIDVRVEMTIEEFFEEFDSWTKSKSTVNRRIERLTEVADADIDVYPHALRATAASAHAARGVSAYSLMSILGWSDISTARSYINANSEQAAREVRSKHR